MRRAPRLLVAAAAALCGCKVAPIADNSVGPDPKELAAETSGRAEDGPAAAASIQYLPLGHAGDAKARPGLTASDRAEDSVLVEDRWRVGFPSWERGSKSDSPYDQSSTLDPYHQNWLKGDYPLPGTQNTFLVVELQSITRGEMKKVPVPSSVFTRGPGEREFFGSGDVRTFEELGIVTLDLFQGETSFKPVDWRFLVKGAFDVNYAQARENTVLYADPASGERRTDRHAALQQAFYEMTLASIDDKYDVVQMRVGTQKFNSDFRGFLFEDEAPGIRFFGNFDDNRWQWNVAGFERLDKDTNSGLNTFDKIGQRVFVANVFRQDVLSMLTPGWKETTWNKGLTSQVSFHHLDVDPSVHYDENGFLVRPRLIGTPKAAGQHVNWLGWTNDGHVGRVNVTSAFYDAWGSEDFDEIAGQSTTIQSTLAALELSYDVDWMRFRVQALHQSGDGNPQDSTAGGFDAIYDNENFAGGEFSFWNRQAIGLSSTGVGLVQGGSLYNTLRSSKNEGNPSFVNPGLLLVGAGFDAQLTPRVKLVTNASFLRFDDTSSLEYVLGQDGIGKDIGTDLSTGVIWRPLLTDNLIVKSGVSALVPASGFRTIYGSGTLYALFTEVIVTW
jgi:hypothetical protein